MSHPLRYSRTSLQGTPYLPDSRAEGSEQCLFVGGIGLDDRDERRPDYHAVGSEVGHRPGLCRRGDPETDRDRQVRDLTESF